MKSSRFWAALILLALTAVVAPVWAAGPLDAGYAVTLTSEGESLLIYLVALQNDTQTQLGFALLDPFNGDWFYGFGTMDAGGHMTGLLSYFDSTEVGQFDLRFQDGYVTGTIVAFDLAFTVSGTKFF